MNNFIKIIPDNFSVKIDSDKDFELDKKEHVFIEKCWDEEFKRTRGKIFNGKILSFDRFEGTTLYAKIVEYKHYVAQSYDKSLFNLFKIRPLAVSGFTTTKNSVLFGKRSTNVTDYKNYLELVPAGGLDAASKVDDTIDIEKQIKLELFEEASIDEVFIKKMQPRYLILDDETETFDICYYIELKEEAEEILFKDNCEYTDLRWINFNVLEEFVQRNQKNIVPASLTMLQLFLAP